MSANPPTGASGETGPEFVLQSVYLKDCSFEAPKGPRVDGNWNPQVQLDLNTQADVVSPDQREVTLTINLTVKVEDTVAFLVEVKQSGLFVVRGLTDEHYRQAIASVAPQVLFPYARAVVSMLIGQGGFPQMLLPPVNFDALYAQSLADAQNNPAAPNQVTN